MLSGQVLVLMSNTAPYSDVLVQTDLSSNRSPDAPVNQRGKLEQLLNDLVRTLDLSDVGQAKKHVHALRDALAVTHGYVSRQKGGIQYRPDFILDAVLFGDCLKPLKSEYDMMEHALHKTLGLDVRFYLASSGG